MFNTAFKTLFYKEVLRFWKVSMQTVAAPVLSSLLYLLIFSHVLADNVKIYDGKIGYTSFLIPGLVMMTILQNAFANTSSSLIQSKMSGNLIFILLTPITPMQMFLAYVGGAMVRGMAVGFCVYLASLIWSPIMPVHPVWMLGFALLGSAIMAIFGLIAGIYSDKFDQLSGFTNFIVTPMTFLAGVFYSIKSLPVFWQTLSHLNPFFYMIDGFRFGFFGLSDTNPWLALAVVMGFTAVLATIAIRLLASGYKLRH
jgi:ABC-2 type transport system permease protein